ncbi:hypothetical protein PR202_ga18220 [Eleusine coracana subsp. coracana]|uniref:Uncharacterized protein n=1 Tax=Eleusine coracana subsp. coracana TaxID=191504 RepID=A0AAV5CSL7_ELECO|nr:hypothetical protein QOZ80_6AG0508070 [Eleusine coracana subsp. coracana]GJN00990.1 hypothetical protein PR202_ga18220 [Eleusine coracana subsp. coracana]
MIQRSFDGLVAFLTTLFPYLPRAEATAYLDAANADPLVAAHLIIKRRGMQRFGFCSGTTVAAVETAVRCAALASKHPDPEKLVVGWKLVSPHLRELASTPNLASLILCVRTLTTVIMDCSDSGTVNKAPNLELEQSWELAGSSSRRVSNRRIPKSLLPPVRAAMKRMLLATIHGFYLQALAKLPTTELRSRYHRSLLQGGYCYGPLRPVSNIIVNTLWHEQNFPMARGKKITLHMISTTNCLWRVAVRSLYGLVSFLCTRYPRLTPDQALRRLLAAEADLRVADPHLFSGMPFDADGSSNLSFSSCLCLPRWFEGKATPSVGVREAYGAAAAAAFHTNPRAQQELLGSPDAVAKLKIASSSVLLETGCDGPLSSMDLAVVSKMLLHCPSSSLDTTNRQEKPTPKVLTKEAYGQVYMCNRKFWDQHKRVVCKVKAALDAYNKDKLKVSQYRLHIICGVNELVSGPEFSSDPEVKGYNQWTPHKYHHCHVNFLATCQGSRSGDGTSPSPVLFFAECSNHGIDEESWCVPVIPSHPDAEQVRCIYCEKQDCNRIVHPTMTSFHGRDVEFEKVLRGEPLFHGSDKQHYTNDRIVRKNQSNLDWAHLQEDDDAIYVINDCVIADDVGDDKMAYLYRRPFQIS